MSDRCTFNLLMNAFQMDKDIDESFDNLDSVLALGKAGDAEFVPGKNIYPLNL